MSERDFVVRLANVTKLFPAGNRQYSLLRTVFRTKSEGDTFAALHAIDLELHRGDRVGLIGNNGAGKSTLLRVVAGLHPPTSGSVEVHGQPTLLAGLGVGMVDELNVEHNIYLYGSMHGIMREDLKLKLDEILQWAELTDFRHATLKNLSTGMRSRLAFSVTRYFNSDIYLLDEALTAGDRVFRERCDDVFAHYARSQRTMLVASHDLKFVRRHCNKVLWLQRGKQMGFGPMEDVLPLYESALTLKTQVAAR
jgi:ABC-type polysaccharide/polyol phosphate transport system ATPase subunit